MGSNDLLLHNTILRLLSRRLDKLAQNHYFSRDLHAYLEDLLMLVEKLRDDVRAQRINTDALQLVINAIWKATQYIAGSTSNRVPYELVFGLRKALCDWQLSDCVVTTSLLQSSEFLCERVNAAPNEPIAEMLGAKLKFELVQIALPEIFQHAPLFCAPLYHEIGHYVEERKCFIKHSLTIDDDAWIECLPDRRFVDNFTDPKRRRKVASSLATEHFCDVFAASYVGSAAAFHINEWVPNEGP